MKFVPLVSVADVQLGKMLSPKAKTGSSYFRYLRNTNVQWDRFDLSDLAQMDFSQTERKKFELRFGDLLVCEGGEPGRCAVWRGELAECYYQKALHRVRPYEGKADAEFLGLWLWHQAVTGAFEDQNAKTTIAHLPQIRLEQLLIPNIGSAEQRQIAIRLKAQLAEVETARQAAHMQVQNAGLLLRAVRQNAFDSLVGRYDRDVPLKDVCSISAGGTPSRANASFFKGNIPWVKTLDLNFGIVTDTEEKISQEGFRAIRGKLLPAGTVMVAMYGGAGTIGKSGVLGIEACTNQAVCALQPNADKLDSIFLHEWLCYIRPEWMRLSGGNRKDPNINKSVVENMSLLLPPLDDQRRIVTRLKTQLAEAAAIAQAAAAKDAGVDSPLDYAIFQDHGYKGLYGGLGAKDIHAHKGLKKSQKILDHMGSTELAANLFRATQTEEKLRRDGVSNKTQANHTHHDVGRKVRQTIEDLGGTMPEHLPVPDSSIQQLESARKKQLKKKSES